MELTGTIKRLLELQTFGSGFQKRSLILLTQEQYPQPINIEFVSDKVSLLDSYKEGDEVKISINIRGREWQAPTGETKYFVSINGWRIEKMTPGMAEPTAPAPKKAGEASAADESDVFGTDEEDDLPF